MPLWLFFSLVKVIWWNSGIPITIHMNVCISARVTVTLGSIIVFFRMSLIIQLLRLKKYQK